MPKIEIYTKATCPYCQRALALLRGKQVEFTDYEIVRDPAKADEMRRRVPGARTVPQILIDDQVIGGSDDLAALDRAGKLDAMLGLG